MHSNGRGLGVTDKELKFGVWLRASSPGQNNARNRKKENSSETEGSCGGVGQNGDGLNARVKIVHEEGSSRFGRHSVLLLQNADPGSSSLEKQRCDTEKPFIADASPGSQILMTSLPKSVPDPVPQPVSNDPSVILHDDINDVTQVAVHLPCNIVVKTI
ncbi:hypothetical protein ACOSP7_016528 [Xanthoceras sorbifolium]